MSAYEELLAAAREYVAYVHDGNCTSAKGMERVRELMDRLREAILKCDLATASPVPPPPNYPPPVPA